MKIKKVWLFRVIMGVILMGILFNVFIYALVVLEIYGPLPSSEDLKSISNLQASEIYDENGVLLDRIYIQDRSSVTFEQISEPLKETLVFVEDKRFYQHSGIDYISLFRVIVKSILLQNESSGGGSTITQQLVKNLYPRFDAGSLYYPVNKMREMILANKVEEIYSKEDILTLYLNTVSFGLDIYGVESASRRFFNKHAIEINTSEAATLIGMLKATTYYNPLLNPQNSLDRRNFILQLMAENGTIELEIADSLKNIPLVISQTSSESQSAKYFTEKVRLSALELLSEYYPEKNYNLKTDGLQIFTTLDSHLQVSAEKTMLSHMHYIQKEFNKQVNKTFWADRSNLLEKEISRIDDKQITDSLKKVNVFSYDGIKEMDMSTMDSIQYHLAFLQSGFLATDPITGEIKSWIGGIDYQFFPYDHVLSKRQVGSIIKPFIYSAALEKGVSPCEYFDTEATSYEFNNQIWTPTNSDSAEMKKLTMESALEQSINTVSVRVLREAGIENTIKLLRKAGINSEIPNVPSIALGTPSISLYEIVEAYSIFSNKGLRQPLHLIKEIRDSKGNILYKHETKKPVRVISEDNAEIMRHFLQNVVNNGTGAALRSKYSISANIGGKTGTTQYGSDGWFISVSPKLVTGTWVGGHYPEIRFKHGAIAQGARLALPICGGVYQNLDSDKLLKNKYHQSFSKVNDVVYKRIDCDPFRREFKFLDWIFNRNNRESKDESIEWGKESESEEYDSTKQPVKVIDVFKNLFRKRNSKKN